MSEGRAQNNFDAVRLVAALLVLYGHAFVLLGLREPLFLSYLPLGTLGVYIFFTISGYFVTESWHRDPQLARFFARRALRIFPALVVCILLTVFLLGPLLTKRSLAGYFSSPDTWSYLKNIGLYIVYQLPGVFETNRYAYAVNGSLWSLPVEFAMYVMVALVGLLGANRWAFLGLAVVSGAMTYFWAWRSGQMLVVYASDLRQIFMCGVYFWVGAVFYKFDLVRRLSLPATLAAATAMLCLEPWLPLLRVAIWGLLPVVVLAFGFAYSPLLGRLTRSGDYSYGVYIYAFPIEQTIAHLWPRLPIGPYLLICSVLTLVCAMLSWHGVERRALALKPRACAAKNSAITAAATPCA